jgi:uncharacterized membrane protein YfcA
MLPPLSTTPTRLPATGTFPSKSAAAPSAPAANAPTAPPTGSNPRTVAPATVAPALAVIATASVTFAPLGAKAAHAMNVAQLKRAFAITLYLLAAYMLYKAVG